MTTISQRNTGSVWDKRARYIEQSTSALQRYVAMGDTVARFTKMKEYTPQQSREADISLYSRLLSDEQKTGPGRMPERSSGVAHTTVTTGWGPKHLAISGVSHQPYIQTAHHSNASMDPFPQDYFPAPDNEPLKTQETGFQENEQRQHKKRVNEWVNFWEREARDNDEKVKVLKKDGHLGNWTSPPFESKPFDTTNPYNPPRHEIESQRSRSRSRSPTRPYQPADTSKTDFAPQRSRSRSRSPTRPYQAVPDTKTDDPVVPAPNGVNISNSNAHSWAFKRKGDFDAKYKNIKTQFRSSGPRLSGKKRKGGVDAKHSKKKRLSGKNKSYKMNELD